MGRMYHQDSIAIENPMKRPTHDEDEPPLPVETLLEPPSIMARFTCVSILMGIFAIWARYTFVDESVAPAIGSEVHSWIVPLAFTSGYLVSLPMLKFLVKKYLSKTIDVKVLLMECMVLYNVAQVLLNGWMVYRFLQAIMFRGHPLVGDIHTVRSGATYAVWVHYCDKYLEFLDTYFMVLRGKMDQVSFLHIYHHTSIAWAWWIGMKLWPGGDAYFGALLNSWIHVMMYSYYALSLLKVPCPWKKYLTQAQLLQFTTVLIYSALSIQFMPKDDEASSWKHYLAHAVQATEMISLFVLFLHFYQHAYYNKKRKSSSHIRHGSGGGAEDSDDSISPSEQASISSASTVDDVDDQCPNSE